MASRAHLLRRELLLLLLLLRPLLPQLQSRGVCFDQQQLRSSLPYLRGRGKQPQPSAVIATTQAGGGCMALPCAIDGDAIAESPLPNRGSPCPSPIGP
jgi:hypothetical protein